MQRIFSAEVDFGFIFDGATDNLAAWDAMWTPNLAGVTPLQPGDKVTFGAGVLCTSGTLVIKLPGVKLEGVGSVYWPYDTSGDSLVGHGRRAPPELHGQPHHLPATLNLE